VEASDRFVLFWLCSTLEPTLLSTWNRHRRFISFPARTSLSPAITCGWETSYHLHLFILDFTVLHHTWYILSCAKQ
jgi:hypothetical protein